eukprot:1690830-Ditylum_brightwellii.AAC.1
MDPLPCDKTTLPLVPQRQEFSFLAAAPSYNEMRAAIMRMANGKSPGPTGVTSDAFSAMICCKADPNQEGLNCDA